MTTVRYYAVPKGESGRFAQDFGQGFEQVTDDPSILFRSGKAVLILKPDAKGKDVFEHRKKQMEEVRTNLWNSPMTNVALVSEYHHPLFFSEEYPLRIQEVDLRAEVRYLHFYATSVFKTQFAEAHLKILRSNLRVFDSDDESLRSEIVNIMRFMSYGLPVRIDPSLNMYRLIELIVQGKKRRKIVHKFDQLARVFTPSRVLNVVIGSCRRWLECKAHLRPWEKSIPGQLTLAGSRTFLPGVLLRSIYFAHQSALPPDVCFSVILEMLAQGRTEYPPVRLEWKNQIKSLKAAKKRRAAS